MKKDEYKVPTADEILKDFYESLENDTYEDFPEIEPWELSYNAIVWIFYFIGIIFGLGYYLG